MVFVVEEPDLNHYLVERDIAVKIKKAAREGRMGIYLTMYQELIEKVPYHHLEECSDR